MTRKKIDWNRLGAIFWTFFRLSPVTFGGGYAMIPVLEQEVVHKRRWIKQEDIADVFAVSQTIPGAVALNSASFIGYRIAGVRGAVAAAVGMMLPALLIIIGVASALVTFQHHPKVEAALQGMKPAVVAMVLYAGVRISRTSISGPITITAAVAAGLLLVLDILSPVFVILIGACVGVLLGLRGIPAVTAKDSPKSEKSEDQEPDYFIGEGI